MRRPTSRIVVCDDEPAARRGVVRALGGGYDYAECASGSECLEALAAAPADLVLLDLRMPGMDGRATLERILELPQPPPVVMVTADSSLRTAVDAVRAGAADFLAKPYEIEELRWVVERTLDGERLRRENRELRAAVTRLGGAARLTGESPAMARLREEITRVAPTNASVLIRGETGTGKELVAGRLHEASAVAHGPFVALNCAAVPESLLESELFGHRKGAFTGADRDRAGRFREAHGGTLFLDEVGDMAAAAQAKLLRVLQDGVVEPLGGGKPLRVEVRVLAATHRDLEALVAAGAFRDDLYYRLRVVELTLPPLRDRGEDVLLLARAFLAAAGPGVLELSPAAARALAAYSWPGNVRELKNAMERAAIFAAGGIVRPEDLPAEIRISQGDEKIRDRRTTRSANGRRAPTSRAPRRRCSNASSAATSRRCCASTPATSRAPPAPPGSTARTSRRSCASWRSNRGISRTRLEIVFLGDERPAAPTVLDESPDRRGHDAIVPGFVSGVGDPVPERGCGDDVDEVGELDGMGGVDKTLRTTFGSCRNLSATVADDIRQLPKPVRDRCRRHPAVAETCPRPLRTTSGSCRNLSATVADDIRQLPKPVRDRCGRHPAVAETCPQRF
jgi:DNA-binding NtrC family response regulator